MKKFANSIIILFFIAPLLSISVMKGSGYSAEPPSPEQNKKGALKEDLDQAVPKKKETPEERNERIRKKLPPVKMVFVKGGCFEMGDATGDGDEDERPAHEVCVGNYYIGETAVTIGLFQAVMDITPPPDGAKKINTNIPMAFVSYVDCLKFIKALNDVTKGFYRLPTEAEWEYAARSRGKRELWAGTNNEAELGDYAWFSDNSNNEVHPVMQKKPNGLGLYDMAGNVWQWTEDNFDFDFYKRSPKKDPFNDKFSTWRTIRGGSAFDNSFKIRATYRSALEPARVLGNVGFRLAE